MRLGADMAVLPHFGSRLRRLRRLRGLKQEVVAELAGVTQPTVSRWEKGELEPEAALACKLLAELSGGGGQAGDGPLRRLVETSSLPVHLIDDADHRLLAASRPREHEWGRAAADLLGRSLWCYATEAIKAAEAGLDEAGWWYDVTPVPVQVRTGEADAGLRIAPGLMLWERLYLVDGTPVRLCTTIGTA